MLTRRPPSGYTLLEVLCALVIAGVLCALALPPAHRLMTVLATRAARDAAAGALFRARGIAPAHGGADLLIVPADGDLRVEADGVDAPVLRLAAEYGVTVVADGAPTDSIRLHFDALGIGRMASRTLRFRRGGAEARLTVSTFGRVRSW